MTPRWGRFPPVMERTLRDDVMLALCILIGAALAALVFGADAAILEAFVIGAVVMIVALNVLRFIVRHLGTHGDE
jgi:hypothetical protein